MNNVTLIGRLVRDPEISYTTTGTAYCKFTIAVDRPSKATEEKGADFIRITTWSSLAERCSKYLSKGRKCAVQGRIQTGSYTNREGKKVDTVEVVANNVEFLDARERPSEREIPKNPETTYDNFSATDDYVPF